MKKDLCEIIVLLDESGSMRSVKNDTIGGFNEFIETHKQLSGEAIITLAKFNTTSTMVYVRKDIQEVPSLDRDTYSPCGGTALLDAVGMALDAVTKKIAELPEEEKPEKVIFLIITDGEENSSKEYSRSLVKTKIEHQKNENWDFVFMGADQDAWTTAHSYGISKSVNFSKDEMGKTMRGMTYYTSLSRTKSSNASMENYNLSDEELTKNIDDLKNANRKTSTKH